MMGVQIVYHQDNFLFGEVNIGQVFQAMGTILFGSTVGDLDMSPPLRGSLGHEQVGGAVSFLFIIIDGGVSGSPLSVAWRSRRHRPEPCHRPTPFGRW